MGRVFLAFAAAFTILLSGCGVGGGIDSNVTMSLRVGTVVYVRDNNETNDTIVSIDDRIFGTYVEGGRFDFYDENITGIRKIERGVYLTSDDNCSAYGVTIEENATVPTMRAPAKAAVKSKFRYLNITPFTTLLTTGNYTKERLAQKYPTAASIDEDFNFDIVSARNDRYLDEEIKERLTQESCEALAEVYALQKEQE